MHIELAGSLVSAARRSACTPSTDYPNSIPFCVARAHTHTHTYLVPTSRRRRRRWELWTGAEPFADLPLHALLHALTQPDGLQLPLPSDRDWAPAWPATEPAPGWAALARRCWATKAGGRPRAAELVAALEAMMAELRRRRGTGGGPPLALVAGAVPPAHGEGVGGGATAAGGPAEVRATAQATA
jgi:hypothetical protein